MRTSCKAWQLSASQFVPGAWTLDRLFINSLLNAASNPFGVGFTLRHPWLHIDPKKISIGSWFRCRNQTDVTPYFAAIFLKAVLFLLVSIPSYLRWVHTPHTRFLYSRISYFFLIFLPPSMSCDVVSSASQVPAVVYCASFSRSFR